MDETPTFCVIVLEGHDGVGKTTLAKALADTLNGLYVRPFAGQTGVDLMEAAEAKNYDLVLKIGRRAIGEKVQKNKGVPLIFDRHWITVLSLLPEEKRACWPHPTHTFLCSAGVETVKKRLGHRVGEEKFHDDYHKYYLKTYLKIAAKCNCTILHTDQLSINQALEKIQQVINPTS